jgi:hypothetical protein
MTRHKASLTRSRKRSRVARVPHQVVLALDLNTLPLLLLPVALAHQDMAACPQVASHVRSFVFLLREVSDSNNLSPARPPFPPGGPGFPPGMMPPGAPPFPPNGMPPPGAFGGMFYIQNLSMKEYSPMNCRTSTICSQWCSSVRP